MSSGNAQHLAAQLCQSLNELLTINPPDRRPAQLGEVVNHIMEMGRYIRNPYVGKEAASSEEVTEKWLEQAVKTIADQIINREFDDEEKQDVGPYTGLSGVAFALNKAAPIVGSKAASTAEKCWQYCERASRRSSSRQARFLCGDLGVYVTQMSNPELRQSLVEKIEKLSVTLAKDDYPSDEMLVGRAGFLSGVLWIRTTIDHTLVSNDCVQKVLSAMILSGRRYSLQRNSPCPLMYDYHGTEYLGAAHGLAGILQMALGFYDLLSDTEERAVRESADWLMSTQDDEGNFASSVKWIGRERGDDQLVHWCHGAPGVILLSLTMWKRYGEQKYFKAALRCGELIWNKGVLKKGPGICHGVGGNGKWIYPLAYLTYRVASLTDIFSITLSDVLQYRLCSSDAVSGVR
ncbi:lanthionine synthetase C-like protein [Ancylostoma caninum]|uniref:Lanthionine synthetase C-like protein n=1 Tax=Ancylostoma caninum TaxID=29170 RepID=A0A368H9S3_ANCCA|nr:lanthionine synthetase C-like protein [Ancylostoma caninum]